MTKDSPYRHFLLLFLTLVYRIFKYLDGAEASTSPWLSISLRPSPYQSHWLITSLLVLSQLVHWHVQIALFKGRTMSSERERGDIIKTLDRLNLGFCGVTWSQAARISNLIYFFASVTVDLPLLHHFLLHVIPHIYCLCSSCICISTPNPLCLYLSPFYTNPHVYSTALQHPVYLYFSVYLHLYCHYLLAEAAICLRRGASSVLMLICPRCVLNLNCCMPCSTAKCCPDIPCCTLSVL